jgi:hypothetical protein
MKPSNSLNDVSGNWQGFGGNWQGCGGNWKGYEDIDLTNFVLSYGLCTQSSSWKVE